MYQVRQADEGLLLSYILDITSFFQIVLKEYVDVTDCIRRKTRYTYSTNVLKWSGPQLLHNIDIGIQLIPVQPLEDPCRVSVSGENQLKGQILRGEDHPVVFDINYLLHRPSSCYLYSDTGYPGYCAYYTLTEQFKNKSKFQNTLKKYLPIYVICMCII